MKWGKTPEEHREYFRWYRRTHKEKIREKNRRYYYKHREEILRKKKEQRKTPEYREYAREYARKRYARLKEKISQQRSEKKLKHRLTWNGGVKVTKEVWQKAEKIAPKILELEGFNKITRIETNFPFDYLCKKDGQIYAVDVTTNWQKEIKPNKIRLMRFAGWKLLFLFIRPNFREYRLIEIPRLTNRYVNVYMEHFPEPIKPLPENLQKISVISAEKNKKKTRKETPLKRQKQTLELIKKKGGSITIKELMRELKISYTYARLILLDLKNKGKVVPYKRKAKEVPIHFKLTPSNVLDQTSNQPRKM